MDGETFHYKVYSFILRPEYVCVFDQAGAQNGCTTGYVPLGKGGGAGYGPRQSWGQQGQYPAILKINQ